jgi:hypothetical protein
VLFDADIDKLMVAKKKLSDLTQQELLRGAMDELGMTRAAFAARLCVAGRTLDKWLLPAESPDGRAMPDMGKAYVREILEWHRKTS